MGIGRFAFTPLLPMMLQDGTVDLDFGSWLATSNYVGYLVGAVLSMALPPLWPSSLIIRWGLAFTVLLTLGMALPWPLLWPAFRFAAGGSTAFVFVFTSGWCLARLASRGAPAAGGAVYTGPGAGIAISGLAASGMVAAQWSASTAWLAVGILAAVLTGLIWPVFKGPDGLPEALLSPLQREIDPVGNGPASAEIASFTAAYGMAGFGYIITATFLPVIAREALPGSIWLDLFWPILGIGVIVGALLAMRMPTWIDLRLVLAACYIFQAAGIVLSLLWPTEPGFIVGSLAVGLPFTAITFFAMQEARRLRPKHVSRLIGLLTCSYSLGQIAGPPLAAAIISVSPTRAEGFGLSLGIASATLIIGAAIFAWLALVWPVRQGAKSKQERG